MSALLAVDGGQTGLRVAVVERGEPGEVTEVAGFSHGSADGWVAVASAVARARDALSVRGPVERVCLGLTGAPRPRELKQRLGALISDRLDGAEVWLGGDMVTAHAGALGGGPGVVVAAGTGTVVLGVAADGTAHRADGLGYLLGDDGSGFAIGRAGIRAALRAREGRGPATALLDAATTFFSGLDDLPHRVYTSASPVSDLAAFAAAIADAARAGDEVARAIWRDAVAALVSSTAAVVRRTFPDAAPGSVAVSHSGRLFLADDILLEPFKAAIAQRCTEARYREPAGDSLAGAARLAQEGLGRYASLMHATPGAVA
jgi:N-acetylglucosamine kinase-like BadF-type ATPase